MVEHIILYAIEFDDEFECGYDYPVPYCESEYKNKVTPECIFSDFLIDNDFLPVPDKKDLANWLSECRRNRSNNHLTNNYYLATFTDPKIDNSDPLHRSYALVYESYTQEISSNIVPAEPKPQQLTFF